MPLQLFALERYETGDVPLPPPHLPLTGITQLLWIVRLPDDDVQMAMVEGPNSETVTASMAAAGWRVDRITHASWVCPPGTGETAGHRSGVPAPVAIEPEVLR